MLDSKPTVMCFSGLDSMVAAGADTDIPIVAIGGINPENGARLMPRVQKCWLPSVAFLVLPATAATKTKTKTLTSRFWQEHAD